MPTTTNNDGLDIHYGTRSLDTSYPVDGRFVGNVKEPERYSNDPRTGILRALEAIQSDGYGTLRLLPNKEYNIGSLTSDASPFEISGLSAFKLEGNNALVSATVAGRYSPGVFAHVNCSNTFWENARFFDYNYDSQWDVHPLQGLRGIILACSGTAVDYKNHHFLNIYGNNITVPIDFYNGDLGGSRLRHITVDGLHADNTYYGILGRQAGTEVTVRGTLRNVRRAILLDGVDSWDYDFLIAHDGSSTSSGLCVYTSTAAAMKNVNGRVKLVGSFIMPIFVHQIQDFTGTGAKAITDCHSYVDASEANLGGGEGKVFKTVAYDSNGTLLSGAVANHTWNRLTFDGILNSPYYYDTPFAFTSYPSTRGSTIHIGPGLRRVLSAKNVHFPNFYVQDQPKGAFATTSGALNSNPIYIPLGLYQYNSFGIEVKTYAEQDTTNNTGGAHTYQHDVLFGYRLANGNLVLHTGSPHQRDKFSHTTTENITYTLDNSGSEKYLVVNFANYTGANAFARAEVTYLKGFL